MEQVDLAEFKLTKSSPTTSFNLENWLTQVPRLFPYPISIQRNPPPVPVHDHIYICQPLIGHWAVLIYTDIWESFGMPTNAYNNIRFQTTAINPCCLESPMNSTCGEWCCLFLAGKLPNFIDTSISLPTILGKNASILSEIQQLYDDNVPYFKSLDSVCLDIYKYALFSNLSTSAETVSTNASLVDVT
jgi:hypothetical protein